MPLVASVVTAAFDLTEWNVRVYSRVPIVS
jgi:hypothetical protein